MCSWGLSGFYDLSAYLERSALSETVAAALWSHEHMVAWAHVSYWAHQCSDMILLSLHQVQQELARTEELCFYGTQG